MRSQYSSSLILLGFSGIPAVCFLYEEGRSSQWNPFEAQAVAALTWLLFGRLGEQVEGENDPESGSPRPSRTEAYDASRFWQFGAGVVKPHRTQQGLVISEIQRAFSGLDCSTGLIRQAVDTVERFQGQQRDVMIATYALGDPDAIRDEEEFLLQLNRFNVMASRARAKLIVLVSREIVNHLSDDIDVLRSSRLLKHFAEGFCDYAETIELGFASNGGRRQVKGEPRMRR